MGQVRNQRFIVNFFVVADLVRLRDGARGDLRKVAGLERGGPVFTRIDGEADGLRLGGDYVAEKLAGLGLREMHERGTLGRISALVHDQYGFGGQGIAEGIAERGARAHHRGYVQVIQRNVFPRAFIHVPSEDCFLAGQVDFGIREARAGIDVRRSRLDVFP